jgi:hypothetical protein
VKALPFADEHGQVIATGTLDELRYQANWLNQARVVVVDTRLPGTRRQPV